MMLIGWSGDHSCAWTAAAESSRLPATIGNRRASECNILPPGWRHRVCSSPPWQMPLTGILEYTTWTDLQDVCRRVLQDLAFRPRSGFDLPACSSWVLVSPAHHDRQRTPHDRDSAASPNNAVTSARRREDQTG